VGAGAGAGGGTLSAIVTSRPFPATSIGPLSACGARLAAAAVTDAMARPLASEDDAVVVFCFLEPLPPRPWIRR
jgi:hypothetical protein